MWQECQMQKAFVYFFYKIGKHSLNCTPNLLQKAKHGTMVALAAASNLKIGN